MNAYAHAARRAIVSAADVAEMNLRDADALRNRPAERARLLDLAAMASRQAFRISQQLAAEAAEEAVCR